MERIRITDVVALLGLAQPPSNRVSYYVKCPCCDEDKERHLNINLKKEVFRCAQCGVAGGTFDLYCLYTGAPRQNVRRELVERLHQNERMVLPQQKTVQQPVETPIADIVTRHNTYILRDSGFAHSSLRKYTPRSFPC